MSVTTLLKDAQIQALLKPFLPNKPMRLGMSLAVPARRNSGSLVGTAFDYLGRFELQHRHHNAIVGSWVAEDALAGR